MFFNNMNIITESYDTYNNTMEEVFSEVDSIANLCEAYEYACFDEPDKETVTEGFIKNIVTKAKEVLKRLWSKIKEFFARMFSKLMGRSVKESYDIVTEGGMDMRSFVKEVEGLVRSNRVSLEDVSYNGQFLDLSASARAYSFFTELEYIPQDAGKTIVKCLNGIDKVGDMVALSVGARVANDEFDKLSDPSERNEVKRFVQGANAAVSLKAKILQKTGYHAALNDFADEVARGIGTGQDDIIDALRDGRYGEAASSIRELLKPEYIERPLNRSEFQQLCRNADTLYIDDARIKRMRTAEAEVNKMFSDAMKLLQEIQNTEFKEGSGNSNVRTQLMNAYAAYNNIGVQICSFTSQMVTFAINTSVSVSNAISAYLLRLQRAAK